MNFVLMDGEVSKGTSFSKWSPDPQSREILVPLLLFLPLPIIKPRYVCKRYSDCQKCFVAGGESREAIEVICKGRDQKTFENSCIRAKEKKTAKNPHCLA